jgi:hypothetical protein
MSWVALADPPRKWVGASTKVTKSTDPTPGVTTKQGFGHGAFGHQPFGH